MSLGPVQLIVLGFDDPDFRGEIVAELERLSENDAVRVIDALAVYKDADGALEVAHLSNVSDEHASESGRVVGALIGLGVEGEEDLELGETATAEQDGWDVLDDIPRDTAAALLLIEHHWAVPLRDAVARAGGFRIGDGFISPLDLVATGLVSAEEAASAARHRERRRRDNLITEVRDVRFTQSRSPHHQARRPSPPLDGAGFDVGGDVRVESARGRGTRVRVTIPLVAPG